MKLCRYCLLKKIETIATRNKRGFDLCQECYDNQAKAERESDEFSEQFYKNQATMNKYKAYTDAANDPHFMQESESMNPAPTSKYYVPHWREDEAIYAALAVQPTTGATHE